jgi:hypothetical protein
MKVSQRVKLFQGFLNEVKIRMWRKLSYTMSRKLALYPAYSTHSSPPAGKGLKIVFNRALSFVLIERF